MEHNFITKGDEVFLLTEDTKTVGLKEAVSQLSMTIYAELIDIKKAEEEKNYTESERLEEKISFQSGVLDSLSNALKAVYGIR